MGALFHLIKGSLGSGILTMPVSFKNGGLWTSLVGALLVGIVYTHCVHIFVSNLHQNIDKSLLVNGQFMND